MNNRTGIKIVGGGNVTLQANQMHGSTTNGIEMTSSAELQPPSNVLVVGNVVEANGRRALWGSVADAIEIRENQFTGSGSGAVNLRMDNGTPGTVLLAGNQFRNGGYAALVSAPTVNFQNNSIVGYAVGIEASAAERAVVVGNTIDASVRTTRIVAAELVMRENHVAGSQIGILARAQRVTIAANRVENSGKIGMQLFDVAEGEITGNDVSGGDTGIYVSTGSQPFGALQVSQNNVHARHGTGIVVGPHLGAGRIDVICASNQVSGNGSTGIAIRTQGDIDATDNIVTGVGGRGILLGGARAVSATRALRNRIARTGGGVAVEGARTVEIDDNDVRDIHGSGYVVSESDIIEVARNRAEGTTRTGIAVGAEAILRGDCNYDGRVTADEVARALDMVFGQVPPPECSAIEPDRNGRVTVADAQEVAINASRGDASPRPPTRVAIHDNTVINSGDVGVLAVAAEQVAAENNIVRGSGSVGLSVTGQRFAGVAIRTNTIEDSGADAILSSGARAVEISGSILHGTGQSGVRIRDGQSVIVTSNEIRQTAETAILATGGGALSVTDNQVQRSSSGGIAAEGLRARNLFAVVERNRVVDVAGAGILLDLAGLAAAADNDVANVGADGIAVRRSNAVRLQGNQIDSPALSAVTVGTSAEPGGADVVIEGNQLKASQKTAVDLSLNGRLVVHANTVQGSGGDGASVVEANPDATVAVVGNRIGPTATDALSVARAGRAFVFDNVVFSVNAGNGLEIRNSGHVEVMNNLGYATSGDGIGLQQVSDARVFNNTLYANARYGVALTATTADVFDNILDQNVAAGLAVLSPAPQVSARFNLNTGAYVGIAPALTDLAADPLFIAPAGADHILGGAGALDDDFHLHSGDNATPPSPAIDAGVATPEVLGISGSTASDGRRDTGLADLGFHYDASPRLP